MATTIDREVFLDAIDFVGGYMGDEVGVREDYSGRAMFGDTCLGVVCSAGEFALLCAQIGATMDDWDFLSSVREDSMGRSTIYYWPNVKLEPEEV